MKQGCQYRQVHCICYSYEPIVNISLWELRSPHPTASLVAKRLKRLPPMRETQVRSLGWEDPLEKEIATHSCLENSMDGGGWWVTVHGVTKSQTQLSDFTFLSFSLPAELPEKPTHDLCWGFYFYEIFLIFHSLMAEASFSPTVKLQNVSLSFEDNEHYHGSISNQRKKQGSKVQSMGETKYQ